MGASSQEDMGAPTTRASVLAQVPPFHVPPEALRRPADFPSAALPRSTAVSVGVAPSVPPTTRGLFAEIGRHMPLKALIATPNAATPRRELQVAHPHRDRVAPQRLRAEERATHGPRVLELPPAGTSEARHCWKSSVVRDLELPPAGTPGLGIVGHHGYGNSGGPKPGTAPRTLPKNGSP